MRRQRQPLVNESTNYIGKLIPLEYLEVRMKLFKKQYKYSIKILLERGDPNTEGEFESNPAQLRFWNPAKKDK
jgi:hypothetical protein